MKKELAKIRYKTNAEQFERFRNKQWLSQRDLAKEIGLDHCCISRFEQSKPINVIHYIQLMDWLAKNGFTY